MLKPRAESLIIKVHGFENFRVGPKLNGCSGDICGSGLGQRGVRNAILVRLSPATALSFHINGEFLRKGVHHAASDTVQTAGHRVSAAAELSTGVQCGQHNLNRRALLHGVLVHGDATSIVGDADSTIRQHHDIDLVAVTCQRLIDRVIDDFIYQVMKTARTG